jgi:hypothetical protein
MTAPHFPLAIDEEQVVTASVGAVLREGFSEGARWIIMRGPSNLCAYVGVPVDHPLARTDAYDALPLEVHGGLTFSGDRTSAPGWFFWGWDYGHIDDISIYSTGISGSGHLWTVDEVAKEVSDVLYDFHRLMRIAERARSDAGR